MNIKVVSVSHSAPYTQEVRCHHKRIRRAGPPHPPPRTLLELKLSTPVKEQPLSIWLAGGNQGGRSTLWTLAALESKMGTGSSSHVWLMFKNCGPCCEQVLQFKEYVLQCVNYLFKWASMDWISLQAPAAPWALLFFIVQHCHCVV